MENNTRISESRYSNPERLPERAETDSFNIVAQKSVKCYGTSSNETASKPHVLWGEITKAEVEVDQVVEETLR